jgi:hypothetical protein
VAAGCGVVRGEVEVVCTGGCSVPRMSVDEVACAVVVVVMWCAGIGEKEEGETCVTGDRWRPVVREERGTLVPSDGPGGPCVVPDGPCAVPDGPSVVPDGPGVVPDGPCVIPEFGRLWVSVYR